MQTPMTDRLFHMILDMKKDQAEIKEATIKNTATLEEHVRRTEASEARLEIQEEKLDRFIDRMEPFEDHVKFVNMSLKVLVGVITLTGIIVGIVAAIRAL